MPHSPVHTEINGAVSTVVLDRREKRNAVDRPTADALRRAFEQFEADDERAVAVLWGAGGTFCAGADLTVMDDPEKRNDIECEDIGPMGPTRMNLSKPVIAAIDGYAVAGGLELALWCDMRIADPAAIFGVLCRRWGVPLIDGGTVRLPRLIGQGRAMDMILTGREVQAEEALQFGLVNRIARAGESRAAAEQLAHRLAQFPQTCLRTDRRSAYESWNHTLPEALRLEGIAGRHAVYEQGLKGADRFRSGAGRHGTFDQD